LYPKLKEGEFISLSLMQFSDIINKSKKWDLKTPYVQENELFMNNDLTENDLVIRHINASKIFDRLLRKCLQKNSGSTYLIDNNPFDFEIDFYGTQNYWFKVGLPLKIVLMLYIILFIPCRITIGILSILSPLSQLNVVLQLQKKRESF